MNRSLCCLAVLLCPAVALCADPPVIELLEDDADELIPKLTMGGISGGEDIKAAPEKDDVFTGKSALRVAPGQRFNSDIKGWNYPIAEKPKEGEYRYLRFAWKKVGDGSIMLQFHTRGEGADWRLRYYMGQNPPPWESKILSASTPTDWQVVTCDLFKDLGARSLGGVAFSPLDGSDGLFDHILLGRTIEDLDKATAKAILQMPAKRMPDARLTQLWADLRNADEVVAATAVWALVAGRKDAVPFLLKNVRLADDKPPPPIDPAKIKPLIEGLTHYRHLTRESATEELFRLGDGAISHLKKALGSADGVAKERLQSFLDRWASRSGVDPGRLRHCVAVLRAIDSPEAKELLMKIHKALP